MSKGYDKTLEYEEAPSGSVCLYNYKEPFMEFHDEELGVGHGYQGVLLMRRRNNY